MVLVIIEILIGSIVGLYLLYYYLAKDFDHWEKRNVRGPKPKVLYGTSKDLFLIAFFTGESMKEMYDAYPDEPAVGLFARGKPVLLIKDLDMIKDVLVKNFASFRNRGLTVHIDLEPLLENLFLIDYPLWKPLRRKLTPVFASGKLKDMFYLIAECTEYFVNYLNGLVEKNEPIDCCEVTAKLTTDVIGVCAFGLDTKALSKEDSEFRKFGRSVMADTGANLAVSMARNLPHWIARILMPFVKDEEAENFFIDTIRNTMEYRKNNNVRRNDFVDLLMDIRDHPEQMGDQEMTDLQIAAQAYLFFLAGFETSSTTMSHALYELALNPDIQDKLRTEVTQTRNQSGGKLTYESIRNMEYLDKVLKETLRKHTPVMFLCRESMDDYKFEKTNISVKKGTMIIIPTHSIHHDARVYPDPEKFDPERFDEKIANSRPHMTYLSFGDGPRMCLGERFAYNQTKLGLATAVANFKFEVCDQTPRVYKKRVTGMLLMPENGLFLRIKKLN